MKLYDFAFSPNCRKVRALAYELGIELEFLLVDLSKGAQRWLSWQLAHLGPAMSKVAFERIVKKVTGQGAPDEAAIAAGTTEFAKLTAILDDALAGREYIAGVLSIADFALASHFSLAATAGLDLGPYRHVNEWLSRVLARDSMRRALADAQAAMRSNAA